MEEGTPSRDVLGKEDMMKQKVGFSPAPCISGATNYLFRDLTTTAEQPGERLLLKQVMP